eukprot:CAMPEP_0182451928 /NCGR_PEP_ID=MMETSP1172-20130603/43978_1 /TAXON_ID=708627 /ORGANISM="Timspurckia oligopyrenoides, Strain CCMP3278" /LENGTH=1215 /DNA_ID=CAMNT_0024649735 /DNA_START=72 /DNA_END=3719 /DNA_ORIENTATION=+
MTSLQQSSLDVTQYGFELLSNSSVSPSTIYSSSLQINYILKHSKSGAQIILYHSLGPLCNLCIIVGTSAHNNGGHAHCLEHLVFLGSKKYPKRGFLDTIATACSSEGTNAWTAQDHTAFTFKCAGSNGLLTTLPLFLDHIIDPLLLESDFGAEVYCMTDERGPTGVVYSEMKAREYSEMDVGDREWRNALYCKGNDGYPELQFDTGGRTQEIARLTHDEVREFHRKHYDPSNIWILIGGQNLPCEELLEILGESLDSYTKDVSTLSRTQESSNPSLNSKGFQAIECDVNEEKMEVDTESILRRDAQFLSSDDEYGGLVIAWRAGIELENVEESVDALVLMQWLIDTPASPLNQIFVETSVPSATHIGIDVRLFHNVAFILSCSGVPKKHGLLQTGVLSTKILNALKYLCDDEYSVPCNDDEIEEFKHVRRLNVEQLQNTTRRCYLAALESLESDPHDYLIDTIVPDLVYSSGIVNELWNTKKGRIRAVNPPTRRLEAQIERFCVILKECEDALTDSELESKFILNWKRKLNRFFVHNQHRVEILLHPDPNLAQLHDPPTTVETINNTVTITENSTVTNTENSTVTDTVVNGSSKEVLEEDSCLEVLEKVNARGRLSSIERIGYSSNLGRKEYLNGVSIYGHSVDVESTFGTVILCFDTRQIPQHLRVLLLLFSELLFSSDVVFRDKNECVTSTIEYTQVVTQLSERLLACDAGIGLGSGLFSSGICEQSFVIHVVAEHSRLASAIDLVFDCMLNGIITESRVKSTVSNLVGDAMEALRDGSELCDTFAWLLFYELNSKKENIGADKYDFSVPQNSAAISVFRQAPFLKSLDRMLHKNDSPMQLHSEDEESDEDSEEDEMEDESGDESEGENELNEVLVAKGRDAQMFGDIESVLNGLQELRSALFFVSDSKQKSNGIREYKEEMDSKTLYFQFGGRHAKESLRIVIELWEQKTGIQSAIEQIETVNVSEYNQIPIKNNVKKYEHSLNELPKNSVLQVSGVESCCIEVWIECEVSKLHADYYALEVLCEVLSRTEGPFYTAVRGNGLAYGVMIYNRIWDGKLTLSITDSENPHLAWNAVCETIERIGIQCEKELNESMVSTAKASVLFGIHNGKRSMSHVIKHGMRSIAHGIEASLESDIKVESKLDHVQVIHVQNVFHKYVKGILEKSKRTCVISVPNNKGQQIANAFQDLKYPIDFEIKSIPEIIQRFQVDLDE